jgi:hypothetical protein
MHVEVKACWRRHVSQSTELPNGPVAPRLPPIAAAQLASVPQFQSA